MTIEPEHPTERLLRSLRTLTAARLRAATRGDAGMASLVARQRQACHAALREQWQAGALRQIAA